MNETELKAAFAALSPREPVEPAHTWKFWTWDLRCNVRDKDPSEFLTWPGVVGTMFVGNAPYIDYEAECLPATLIEVIIEPGIGKPVLYNISFPLSDDIVTSGNLIHQAYHLDQWESANNKDVQSLDTIIEIGGGYGAMALIIRRLGFKGRYIIYDLPEFSLLQQYYLSNCGVDDIEFSTQIDDIIEADLLIGLYSLSEFDLAARDRILELCPAQSYLIAYGARWGGWDNTAWAHGLMNRKDFTWRNWNIGHLPNCWYLVGDQIR